MVLTNTVLVLIAFIPILCGILNFSLKTFRSDLRHIPGPWLAKFSSLWRVWMVYDGSAHDGYRKLHERYGKIVRTAPNVVDISDPDVIPTIYGVKSKFEKSSFYHVFDTVYDNEFVESMFSTTRLEEHKRLKRSVSQKYSMTSIRSLEYLVDPCSQIFTDAMSDLQGQIVDLGIWVQWYAFDVIGAITFSRRYGFMEERRDVNNVIAGIESGLLYGGLVGQIPWLHKYLLGNRTSRNILERLTGGIGDPIPIVTKMVLDSIAEYNIQAADETNRGDFLSYLKQQQEQQDELQGSRGSRDMVNHLTNNLLAGSDTTGISLRAIFYYLIQNRQAYQTLQREIDASSDHLSPVITYAESLKLPYLQACIKEAMRMHPGVAYPLERVVPVGGVELCNRQIPAGAIVGVNAAVIHRNTDIFGPDANDFRPERWLGKDDAELKTMDRTLLTFGGGTRSCIGKHISIMEIGKLVPQVLRQFDVEWASKEPLWRIDTYWFAKQSGLLVRMKLRR